MKNANPHSRRGPWAIWLAAAALALCGCGREGAVATEAPHKTIADHFAVRLGSRTVSIQVAVLQAELERGLMERKELGPDEGMLFVFREPERQAFWMHDTPTPLDIGYFEPDGTLAEIYPLLPYDERSVFSKRKDIKFALEMNNGWFAHSSVKSGDQIDLAAVAAALKERGFDPAEYGLQQAR